MGVFQRDDSKYWWLYLETNKTKERTEILIGTTTTQRRDSKALAQQVYHQRMVEIARRVHRLPPKPEASTFAAYATTYETDVIAHRRGADRERELLKHLRGFFDRNQLLAVDRERVQAYQTARLASAEKPSKSTVNREVDLLKVMLRDAV